jgi:glycosyltransferase involved in cell wall biosynthesis
MMDLWCYTPHYDRYLCQALNDVDVRTTLGSVCPYQDPQYFERNGLHNDPGFLDLVPKLGITNDNIRRALMLVETCLNMVALLIRFCISKPDIVHVQWTPMIRRLPFEIWFLRFARRLQIRLVYTVHNILPHDTGKRFMPVFKRMYTEMDALICHTHEAKSRLVHEFTVDPRRVRVIPHGPLLHDAKRHAVGELKAKLCLRGHETLVLWQGIIRPYKGLDFLLQAWCEIACINLNARLIVAGTGEAGLLKSIKENVERLGLHESVRLDFRFIPDEEVATYFEMSDVLVYPYSDVTTSGALMTALAYRKAIVATNLPAFHEVLSDKEDALLVNYGDVGALASALSELIRDPKKRESLAHKIAARADLNSWSHIARETRRCYALLLQTGRAEELS